MVTAGNVDLQVAGRLLVAAAALVNLNVARGQQGQVVETAADLEYRGAVGTQYPDIEPVGVCAALRAGLS